MARKLVAGVLVLGLIGGLSAPAQGAASWTPANDLEGACVTLQAFNGSNSLGYVWKDSVGYGFKSSVASAEPFRLEATQLGRYVLRDQDGAPPYQSVLNWVWPPARCGATTIRRASLVATLEPCSCRTRCRHASMPAAVPAEVMILPSWMYSASGTTSASG